MKILLLGKMGQLGWELQRSLGTLGQITALDYAELDLENFSAVRKTIQELAPQVIVNAAAYTAVDRAENESDKAFAINAVLPGILAEQAMSTKAVLVHYSTDYVFDGTKGSTYTEQDTPNPLGVYAASKLAGEQAIQAVDGAYLVLRTSWVYSLRRDSFVTKVLQWARQNETVRIVSDQVSNPTWARMLAEATALLIAKSGPDLSTYFIQNRGVYHLAGSGYTSRFGWAEHILKIDPNAGEQIIRTLVEAATQDFPTPAKRPLFSALDCSLFERTFGLHLPEWRQALQLAML